MKVFFTLLIAAVVTLGVSVESSAKDKMSKAEKKEFKQDRKKVMNQCGETAHWLQPPTPDLCDGKQFTKGFIQCGAYIVTGYCKVEVSGNASACLDENSGDTKDCYKRTTYPFSERLKKMGKKAFVEHPACVWASDSFLPANDIDVPLYDGQQYIYRRASCSVEGQQLTPMLFCKLESASNSARECMENEGDPNVAAVRRAIEPGLLRTQYEIRTGTQGTRR